jgi:neopullulanase
MLVVKTERGVEAFPLDTAAETGRFTFWEVIAGPFEKASGYSFAFRTPNGKGVYLSPGGVTNAIERLDRWPLEPVPPMSVPDWARGAVIYQIFPDRFARAGTEEGRLDPWESPPTHRGFKGGSLDGVLERLDHIHDLGVDALYINPVFTSPSNHRYDTVDYYNIDPLLGGNEALSRLVGEAHRRSMRVILDASFNHVHPDFFAFADVRANGPDSTYWDWFVVNEWPLRLRYRPGGSHPIVKLLDWVPVWAEEIGIPAEAVDDDGPPIEPSYEAWYGVPTMPRVNLANAGARSYMLEVAAYWPREFGIDGWRMDVARYVDPDFWNDFRVAVRTAKADAYLLCEVMGDASSWLNGDRFDGTMNYTFRQICLRFFADDEIEGGEFLDEVSRLWAQYAWPVTLASQNLLSSHDTPRFLSRCESEIWRTRLALVFQMTYPGAPGIYYGDEVGMEGGEDPGSRGAYPWDVDSTGHPLLTTTRELTRLRRHEPALVTGSWRPLHGRENLVVFERRLGNHRIVVVINRSADPDRYAGDRTLSKQWGDGEVEGDVITVGPRSALIASC